MIIGGLQKFSLLDYPDHISAIIFTQGCNFRCHFCYNPMLVRPNEVGKGKNISVTNGTEKGQTLVKEDDLFQFLGERAGKLEGVVITGGEPTLHADLPLFIKKIKDLGYLVKLDTNGTNPEMLQTLAPNLSSVPAGAGERRRGESVDYIAMDIKAPFEKYEKVVGAKTDLENIKKSVKILMNSGLPYEFRTTMIPGLHEKKDIEAMGSLIKGAGKWYLQKFKSDVDLVDLNYKGGLSFSDKEMAEMVKVGKKFVKYCEWR
jgi:pyruvate formate lyase activating enzyme